MFGGYTVPRYKKAYNNAQIIKSAQRYFLTHGLIYNNIRINLCCPGQYTALQV